LILRMDLRISSWHDPIAYRGPLLASPSRLEGRARAPAPLLARAVQRRVSKSFPKLLQSGSRRNWLRLVPLARWAGCGGRPFLCRIVAVMVVAPGCIFFLLERDILYERVRLQRC
jgi:hypothetical protein